MQTRLLQVILLFLVSSLVYASNLPPIKPGMPGKKRGDIIAPMLDEQIAAWCDFNKQIVVTRTNVLCAYVGDKTEAPIAVKKLPPKRVAQFIPQDLKETPYEMKEYGDAIEA